MFYWVDLSIWNHDGNETPMSESFWREMQIALCEDDPLFDTHGDGIEWCKKVEIGAMQQLLPKVSENLPMFIIECCVEDDEMHNQTVTYYHRGEVQDANWRIVVDPPKWFDK